MKYISKSFINEIILSELNLLLENRIDFLKTNLLPKIKSNLGLDNINIFNKLSDMDPTFNKQYLQWLINQYIKIQDNDIDVYRFLNLYKKNLKSDLDIFDRNKQNLKDSNINNYNIENFNNIINKIKENPENIVRGLEKKERYNPFKIGNIDNFSIYRIPKGRNDLKWVSVGLGKETTWCTAYEAEEANKFDWYINQGDLIIMINNSNPSEKYQYSEATNELKNKDDDDVDFYKFKNIFSFLSEKIYINLPVKEKILFNIPLTKEESTIEDLDLSHTKINSLPDNLIVNGTLDISHTPIESLPNNLMVYRYLKAVYTKIKTIPKDLIVGDLNLEYSEIESIPDNFIVYRGLYLAWTPIESLPNNLTVKGDLNISNTSIEFLPKDLNVGGNIFTDEKFISHNYISNYLGKYLYSNPM